MNKNVALGLEIGLPILLIGIVFGGQFYKSNSDSNAAAESQANRASYAQEQDEMIRGGGKKSKRRKHGKNASKKRR